jgi:hypothetical protein
MATKKTLLMTLVTNPAIIMKKVFYFFAIAALACATACQREVLPVEEISETEGTFTFTSAKPVLGDENPTRTEWTGETIQWSKDDQIRMAFTVDGVWQGASDQSTAPKLYASKKLEEATDIAEFTVNASFTSTATGTHVFYGLYPGSLVSSTSFNEAPIAAINIPSEQTPAADSFDGAADVLIGVSEELAERPSSEETVLMSWTRLVAHADLTIKNLTINDGESIDNVTLTAQDGADLVGMHSLNLVTGEVSNPQGATNEIVIKADNLTFANKTMKVWASMLPATLTELTVTVETDKAYYVRSFTGISREFKKNMRNTMNIGMTSAVRTEKATDLEDYEESFNNTLGDFTVQKQVLSEGLTYVWAKNSGYAKASAYKSGQAYAATSYLVSPALTIGSDNSKLTFEHAANYLNGAAFEDYFSVVVFDGDEEKELTLDVKPDGKSWNFVTSSVSLSNYDGKAIKIGFKYTSTSQLAGTWEIRNLKVTDVKAAEAPAEYTISVNPSENGSVTVNVDKAVEGTEITLSVAPAAGYELDVLSVVDANNNAVTVSDYKFLMPASNVTVSASFKQVDPSLIEKGETWTYTFEASQYSTTKKTATLNEIDWTMSGTGGEYFGYDATKGQQFGSGSKPFSAITLSSSFGNTYGIESIAINTSGAASINATVAVSVNGVAYKCDDSETASLTASATTYVFNSPNGLNAGIIEISFANSSAKAIYIKTITVNPEGTIVDPVKLVMSDITCTNSGESENTLSFSWTAVENADGYKVSIDGTNFGETQTGTSYIWTGLSAGTTYTLKVKAVGDGTNYLDSDPKSCSGSTKSVQSGEDVYSLYSGELTEGDYIIVYGSNAMKNSISSNRLTYSTVTISSDNTITGPSAEIVWHISKSGDYWTIYNASVEKFAAGNGTKNQAALLESGNDDGSLWTVSGSETYDFVNKKNSAANVNATLRNNGTYGFACYAQGTGGALSLYKLN